MRVGLITSFPPERCGVASNAVNLVNNKADDVEYKIIEGCSWRKPFTHDQVMAESEDCDIVHLTYERSLHLGLFPGTFYGLREKGKKTIITYYNIWPGDYQDAEMVKAFDVVIVPDEVEAKVRGYEYVPHGVMEVTELGPLGSVRSLGTAGFPTPAKGSLIMADVCRELGLHFFVVAPLSRHADAAWMRTEIEKRCQTCSFVHEFLLQEEIVRMLSCCTITAWLYTAIPQQSGLSGSIRLGCAAKRPMVASMMGMYRDLFQYDDEINFIQTETPTFATVLPVVQYALEHPEKRPDRVVKEQSWNKCGQMYAEIYRKVLAA
jgi:hypothetical protein